MIIAGLLVGFGTKKGNGCTSGHGVCGLSSFRLRSFVATLSFMLTGFITAMATNTYGLLPSFKNEVSMEHGYGIALVIIGISITLALFAFWVNRTYPHWITDTGIHPTLSLFYSYLLTQELLFGILFGLSMGVANMTLLSAVISFLDLRYWNPALGFVMGGAICVALPVFYLLFHPRQGNKNVASPTAAATTAAAPAVRPFLDVKFHLSKLQQIDRSLVIGSAIFGIGWGLMGACPGPALTNIGSGNIPPVIYAFAIVVGMYLEYGLNVMMEYYCYPSTMTTSAAVVASTTTTTTTVVVVDHHNNKESITAAGGPQEKFLTKEDVEDSNRSDG